VRRVVLDAEAFLDWFAGSDDLRAEYEAGSLAVVVPPQFSVMVLEAVAARQGASPVRLARLADLVERVGFVPQDPPVELVAARLAAGWKLAHAQYAALSDALGIPLVAADEELRRRASALLLLA
jgi:predicted nucleic acid-binding protein